MNDRYADGSSHSQGGFLQLIILIIVALFIMKYMGLTISDVVGWFTRTFHNVLQ